MRKRKSGGLSAGIVVPAGQPPAGTTAGLAFIRLRRAGEIAVPGGTVIDDVPDQPSRSRGRPRSSCWEKRAAKMAGADVLRRAVAHRRRRELHDPRVDRRVLTGPEVEREARREVDVARQDHAARVGGEPAHDGVERLLVAAPALDVEALGPADRRPVVIGLGLALGVRLEVDDPRRQRLDQRLDGVGHQDRHRRRRRPAARARR